MSAKVTNLKKKLQRIMKKRIREIKRLPFEEQNSLTGRAIMGKSPISKFQISFEDGEMMEVIIKFKSSKVITNGIAFLNYEKSPGLYYYLARYHRILGYDRSFLREIVFYNTIAEKLKYEHQNELKELLPFVFGTYRNMLQNSYMIVMREFSGGQKTTRDSIYPVLDNILKFHILFYGKRELISNFKLNFHCAEDYKKARPLLRGLFEKFKGENSLYFKEELPFLLHFIDAIHERKSELKEHFSLTHNDFCPRNLFFDGKKIIFYDWELAAYQNPEHDLVEYLCFVLHEFSDSEVMDIIEYYKNKLFGALNLNITQEEYRRILEFNISEFIINKLSLYRTAAKTFSIDFVEELCLNSARLLRIIKNYKKSQVII